MFPFLALCVGMRQTVSVTDPVEPGCPPGRVNRRQPKMRKHPDRESNKAAWARPALDQESRDSLWLPPPVPGDRRGWHRRDYRETDAGAGGRGLQTLAPGICETRANSKSPTR